MRGQTGRAELLRALAERERDTLTLDQVDTHWWGYERQREVVALPEDVPTAVSHLPVTAKSLTGPALPVTRRPLTMPESWKVTERWESTEPVAAVAPLTAADLAPLSDEPLVDFEDLVPLPRLLPALRPVLSQGVRGGVDVPALVRHAARLSLPRRLPRQQRQRWHPDLVVVFDFAPRLTPYHFDMHQLAAALARECGRTGLSLRCLDHGPSGGWRPWVASEEADELPEHHRWAAPAPGALCLVVSDLGLLSGNPQLQTTWRDWLAGQQQAGTQLCALLPVGADDVPRELCSQLPIRRWSPESRLHPETGGVGPSADAPGLSELLAMVAVSDRVDPPLLRAFRQALPLGGHSAGLEARVWGHAKVRAGTTCQVERVHRDELLGSFARLPTTLQTAHRKLRLTHHHHLRRALHWSEELSWAQAAADGTDRADAAERALQVLRGLLAALDQRDAAEGVEPCLRAAEFLLAQLPDSVQVAHRALLGEMQRAVVQRARQQGPSGRGVNATEAASQPWRLVVDGEAIWLEPGGTGASPSVLAELGTLTASDGVWIRVSGAVPRWSPLFDRYRVATLPCGHGIDELELQLGRLHVRLGRQERPKGMVGWGVIEDSWIAEVPDLPSAARFLQWDTPSDAVNSSRGFSGQMNVADSSATFFRLGFDKFGVFLDLLVGRWIVVQRFRYLEPGTFLMGSPDDEAGSDGDEHPRHPVTLTQGLWLADAPCSQALWQAVMGNNPSHHKDATDAADRPVENVSWEDVQSFLTRLQALLPEGLVPVLPTEAEWEYACRAGSDTAYAWGDDFDPAKANVGHGDGALKETSAVKRYAPNAWGLYDLHGNVWEWCADGQRKYGEAATTDPRGPEGPEDGRVLRGGSFNREPVDARSAYRHDYRPGFRIRILGFRFALRSPSPGPGGPGVLGAKAGGRSPTASAEPTLQRKRSQAKRKSGGAP